MEARTGGRERGRSIGRRRLTEPEKVRIAEFRRQGSIQLPQEPRVLGRRQVATRETRGVDRAQRVTEEARIRARGDEERAGRGVRGALERNRPEGVLEPFERPGL